MASPPYPTTAEPAQPPLRILSLDGGGVRGYSMLVILQELMHLTHVQLYGSAPHRTALPKPCDHFDLIVGTGTGGLIALMLGRLRLDVETCKRVYVRMTKLVFETDKTIAGIPYRKTMFKAAKLEEAIKRCVEEYTVWGDEGNDYLDAIDRPIDGWPGPARSSSTASRYSLSSSGSGSAQTGVRPQPAPLTMGIPISGPNALLYDRRAHRTRTAVMAVYKGTPRTGRPTLLRSYDSPRQPAPESECAIWQAGRATCATAMAFKPVRIGQSVFLDEGAGKYNPCPDAVDEAVVNEWPGREVGVVVSIGTGVRPLGTAPAGSGSAWEELFADFAEARHRLIDKIDECERIHRLMLSSHLSRRGIRPEAYVRLNPEVGVGDFAINEWARLADLSTLTRRYLGRDKVHRLAEGAAMRLADIYGMHRPNYPRPAPANCVPGSVSVSGSGSSGAGSGYGPGAGRYSNDIPELPGSVPVAVAAPVVGAMSVPGSRTGSVSVPGRPGTTPAFSPASVGSVGSVGSAGSGARVPSYPPTLARPGLPPKIAFGNDYRPTGPASNGVGPPPVPPKRPLGPTGGQFGGMAVPIAMPVPGATPDCRPEVNFGRKPVFGRPV